MEYREKSLHDTASKILLAGGLIKGEEPAEEPALEDLDGEELFLEPEEIDEETSEKPSFAQELSRMMIERKRKASMAQFRRKG